ncbi:MAG: hypothetical protein F6K23_15245 [Okeania sp. SIO2C9]|uniref:hypothetical protein n=1 Tax=Okeania sp. SIO2C9 TaxID=2607791 RepID=UPI0013C18853|nr:hypothetical protein [Okeania sp. SIO2C9]NEQ74273.1 hypothetical protein [Okeania sp. SIO2C9]
MGSVGRWRVWEDGECGECGECWKMESVGSVGEIKKYISSPLPCRTTGEFMGIQ